MSGRAKEGEMKKLPEILDTLVTMASIWDDPDERACLLAAASLLRRPPPQPPKREGWKVSEKVERPDLEEWAGGDGDRAFAIRAAQDIARYALSLESSLKAVGEERDAAKARADKAEALSVALEEEVQRLRDVPDLIFSEVDAMEPAETEFKNGYKAALREVSNCIRSRPAPSSHRGDVLLAAAWEAGRQAQAEFNRPYASEPTNPYTARATTEREGKNG